MNFEIGQRVHIRDIDATGTIINIRNNWYLTIRLDVPNPDGVLSDIWIATLGEVDLIQNKA